MKEYDVVVIGSGPAGHYAAIQAAKLEKKVALVEKRQVLGGVCLNTGTIPSKTLREAVIYLTGLRQKALYGMSYAVKRDITMDDLRLRTSHVIKTETEVFRAQLQRNHVDLLNGAASFLDDHRLLVDNGVEKEVCSGDLVVIATGTSPAHSDRIPLDGTSVVDSDMFLCVASLPRSLTIVGAGVIGVEYACMTAALGISTTLVEARDQMLDFLIPKSAEALRYHMRDMGITLRLREEVVSVRKTAEGTVIAELKSRKEIHSQAPLLHRGQGRKYEYSQLEAAGRTPTIAGRIRGERALPDRRSPHLCRWRCDWVSEPGFGFHDAGALGDLPRLWRSLHQCAQPLPVRYLHNPRDFVRRPERGPTDRTGDSLRSGHCALSGDRSWQYYRGPERPAETLVPPRNPPVAGRPHNRRRSSGVGSHRTGRSHVWGRIGLLPQQRV